MAKKTTSRAQGRPQGKAGASIGLWVGMAAFMAAVVVIPAVAALLIVGLAPSIVSWLANQSPNRQNQLLTVLTLNLAGVMPYLERVLASPRGLNTVLEITGNVFSWLVMYGAAAAAMMILIVAPQLAAMALQLLAHERLRNIAGTQASLVEEWGEGVAGKTD